MTHNKKLRLNRLVLIFAAASLSALTGCSVLGGLLPGGEPPPAPQAEEPVVAEALPEEAAGAESMEEPPTPTPLPTATQAAEEELVVPEPDKESEEATPTPSEAEEGAAVEVTPLGGATEPEAEVTLEGEAMPEGEVTPEATVEGETTPEATVEEAATPEPGSTPEAVTTTVAPTVRTYTVKAGDTLGEIASANNTTVAEIVGLNQGTYPSLATDPDKIEVGWVLKLAASGETYTVQQADTLDEIATEFGTTIETLVSLNEDSYPSLRTNPGKLEIGWVLAVP